MRLVLILAFLLAGCGSQSFDQTKWAEARGAAAPDNPRASMVCDAVAAGLVPGARKRDLRELLGAPDEEYPDTDIYEVGLEFTAPDTVSLSIGYTDDGIVDQVALRHDWGSERLSPRAHGTCGGNWDFQSEQ